MQKIQGIRGAITSNSNSKEDIQESTIKLISEILNLNSIDIDSIVNITFTVTDDLDEINPATVSRANFKLDSVPMICVQEMKVKGGLERCIRILLQLYTDKSKEAIKHVYLGGAEILRPDLSKS